MVSGQVVLHLAKKYGVNEWAMYNHRNNHMSRQLIKAYEIKEQEHGLNLLERIDKIISRAERIFRRNYAAKRDGTALKALDSQRATFELLCKISAHLHAVRAQEQEQNILEEEHHAEQDAAKALQILTNDELLVYRNIITKLQTKDKNMNCLEAVSANLPAATNELKSNTTEETSFDTGDDIAPETDDLDKDNAPDPDTLIIPRFKRKKKVVIYQ